MSALAQQTVQFQSKVRMVAVASVSETQTYHVEKHVAKTDAAVQQKDTKSQKQSRLLRTQA